jgi:hypothetical protein
LRGVAGLRGLEGGAAAVCVRHYSPQLPDREIRALDPSRLANSTQTTKVYQGQSFVYRSTRSWAVLPKGGFKASSGCLTDECRTNQCLETLFLIH